MYSKQKRAVVDAYENSTLERDSEFFDIEVAIRVSNLSKCYQIYSKPSDRLLQMLFRGYKNYYRDFWALKSVSFEVGKGEVVGIVGRNGSGKSTLLQMICGTLNPSAGDIQVNGSIAALLELGAGFNPDFTGRENVYLYASILGLTQELINERFAEIESFADIGQFIDQPVKTYSSGMLVRLAFAVSVSREPDILIVDEALAVGDEAFRRKCFARIEALRERGTSILFVSHAASLVVELCDRAVLLESGELLFAGTPKETIALYNKLLFTPDAARAFVLKEIRKAAQDGAARSDIYAPGCAPENTVQASERPKYIEGMESQSRIYYESYGAEIIDPRVETLDGERVNMLVANQEYQYCYQVHFRETARKVQFGMLIKNISGLELGGALHPKVNAYIERVEASQLMNVSFKFRCLLNPGTYFLNSGVQGENVNNSSKIYLHRIIDAVMFKVQPYNERESTALINFDIASVSIDTEFLG